MTEQTIKCDKCTMTFIVATPSQKKGVERMRCPDCLRPFWGLSKGRYVKGKPTANSAFVGIEPRHVAKWENSA